MGSKALDKMPYTFIGGGWGLVALPVFKIVREASYSRLWWVRFPHAPATAPFAVSHC